MLVVGCGGAVYFSPEEMLASRQLTEMDFAITISLDSIYLGPLLHDTAFATHRSSCNSSGEKGQES